MPAVQETSFVAVQGRKLEVLRIAGADRALSVPWLLTYYLLSIGLSYGSYRFIERPSLALRKRYGSHALG